MVCKHCHTFLSCNTANGNRGHHPEPEVCTGGRAHPQQQQPTSLRIVHEWYALKEFLWLPSQELLHMLWVPNWSPQDLQPLPCCGQLLGSSPDHCIWNPHSGRCGDDVNVLRNNTSSVPHLCFFRGALRSSREQTTPVE